MFYLITYSRKEKTTKNVLCVVLKATEVVLSQSRYVFIHRKIYDQSYQNDC